MPGLGGDRINYFTAYGFCSAKSSLVLLIHDQIRSDDLGDVSFLTVLIHIIAGGQSSLIGGHGEIGDLVAIVEGDDLWFVSDVSGELHSVHDCIHLSFILLFNFYGFGFDPQPSPAHTSTAEGKRICHSSPCIVLRDNTKEFSFYFSALDGLFNTRNSLATISVVLRFTPSLSV